MKILRTAGIYVLLAIAALVSIIPFYLSVSIAFKPANLVYTTPPWEPPFQPTLDNFFTVWTRIDMPHLFLNTVIVATVVTIGQVTCCTLAGYAFARMSFPGRDKIFWIYVATLIIPATTTILPLFLIMRGLGVIDTLPALILPFVLGGPYGVFLMRQFFSSLPTELEDAAQIDGAGTLQTIWRIVLPLSRPILATLAVITFISTWQSFLWPAIVSTTIQSRMMTVGIANMTGSHAEPIQLILAASTLSLIPLFGLFVLFQRHIVKSIVLSGFK